MSAIVKEQPTGKGLDTSACIKAGAPGPVMDDATPEIELILTVIGGFDSI